MREGPALKNGYVFRGGVFFCLVFLFVFLKIGLEKYGSERKLCRQSSQQFSFQAGEKHSQCGICYAGIYQEGESESFSYPRKVALRLSLGLGDGNERCLCLLRKVHDRWYKYPTSNLKKAISNRFSVAFLQMPVFRPQEHKGEIVSLSQHLSVLPVLEGSTVDKTHTTENF